MLSSVATQPVSSTSQTSDSTSVPDFASIRVENAAGADFACCEPRVLHDLGEYLKVYVREKPGTAALVCLGVGFVLGWRLRQW